MCFVFRKTICDKAEVPDKTNISDTSTFDGLVKDRDNTPNRLIPNYSGGCSLNRI
jgi:hypothetical protein